MNGLRNEDGMTIVEVMAAFLILLITAAFFSQAVLLSLNIQRRFLQERDDLGRLTKAYYLGDGDLPVQSQTVTLEFITDQGETYRLPVELRSFKEGLAVLYDVRGSGE